MVFTGLIEEIGRVSSLVFDEKTGGCTMTISPPRGGVTLQHVQLGDSICVNGVCLTVTSFQNTGSEWWFTVGLAPETLRRTNLGDLKRGDGVNLERALAANSRMGGHFVQGHVDGTGVIAEKRVEKDSLWITVTTSPNLMKYIVEKAFITVDGTSLTVCDVGKDTFSFMLIAYTQQKVVIPHKKIGDRVNLEVDIVAKYVEKLLLLDQAKSESQSPLISGIRAKL